MLADRSYSREAGFGPGRSVTVTLLVVNAVFFVAQSFLEHYRILSVTRYFGLNLAGLMHGYLWQLLSFQFLHGGFLHLLLNSWGIYVFGRAVEEALGARRFLQLYLLSGGGGGLLHVLGSLVLPHNFGGSAPVVGASAGLFGLIAAYAALFPHQRLTLLLFFVLPVSLTARALLIISTAIALFGILVPTDNIAHGAHLGGLLTGLFCTHRMLSGGPLFSWRWPRERRAVAANRPPIILAFKGVLRHRSAAGTDESEASGETFRREVDAILDKISAQGIQSLTDRERRVLETARSRMTRS